MAFIKKTTIISGRDIGKRPLLRDAGENVISVAIISDFWYYNITPFFEYKSFFLWGYIMGSKMPKGYFIALGKYCQIYFQIISPQYMKMHFCCAYQDPLAFLKIINFQG